MFRKLTPRQRKYLAILGAASVLALIYLLQRRRAPVEEAPVEEQVFADQAPVPGGGADAGAYIGALGNSVTDALGGVQAGLEDVAASQAMFGEQFSGGLGAFSDQFAQFTAAQTAADERTAAMLDRLGVNVQGLRSRLAGQRRKRRGRVTKQPAGNAPVHSAPGGTPTHAGGNVKPKQRAGVGQARAVSTPSRRPAPAPAPRNVTGPGGGVARVGGAGGASGGQVHARAYSSGIGAGRPKPRPPRGYHTYRGANGQWWFAPNN